MLIGLIIAHIRQSFIINGTRGGNKTSFRTIVGSLNMYPYFAHGKVVKGFGRGSKELGIPTANYPDNVVESLPKEFNTGIYYGWASVDSGAVHKMVMSIGWNPYYKNSKKTMETHIMHTFKDDFYGADLKVCILGYIRPEADFTSLDALIAMIHQDIAVANEKLEVPENQKYLKDNFFTSTNGIES